MVVAVYIVVVVADGMMMMKNMVMVMCWWWRRWWGWWWWYSPYCLRKGEHKVAMLRWVTLNKIAFVFAKQGLSRSRHLVITSPCHWNSRLVRTMGSVNPRLWTLYRRRWWCWWDDDDEEDDDGNETRGGICHVMMLKKMMMVMRRVVGYVKVYGRSTSQHQVNS